MSLSTFKELFEGNNITLNKMPKVIKAGKYDDDLLLTKTGKDAGKYEYEQIKYLDKNKEEFSVNWTLRIEFQIKDGKIIITNVGAYNMMWQHPQFGKEFIGKEFTSIADFTKTAKEIVKKIDKLKFM